MLLLNSMTLADLLLSRLLFAPADGMTTSALRDAVKAIAGSELSRSKFTARIEQTLRTLSEQDYVQSVGRSRHHITEMGRQHILDQLGITALPPKLQWNAFKNADWIAHALKLPALSSDTRKRLANADGLRAAILKHAFGLPIDDFVTLTQARNALLWQHFCNPETAKSLQTRLPELRQQAFNQGTVTGALLNDLLQTSKPLPWKKALLQLTAKVANAKRTTPDELRSAILRQALDEPPAEIASVDVVASSSSASPDATDAGSIASLSDAEFAEMTLQAAKETQEGRLGDYKVFIFRVWETLQQRHPNLKLSLADFKQRLVRANQQQLLILSRADMAQALDSEDVATSEINHLNSTFHFIYLD